MEHNRKTINFASMKIFLKKLHTLQKWTHRLKISHSTIILLFYTLSGVPEGYQDRCELQFEGCIVEFYFSTMDADPVMIESSNSYSCPASTIPWIIAGSLVGAILLLGILALIILKICLVFLVSGFSYYECFAVINNSTLDLRRVGREGRRKGTRRGSGILVLIPCLFCYIGTCGVQKIHQRTKGSWFCSREFTHD